MLNLLARFHDPGNGRILFDGVDTSTSSARSQRAFMGVVLQDTFLFNTTIRENIQFGRPHASAAEIEAAARDAEIHDAILEMPGGYDTIVGERGVNLSGGERQRISLARALLRKPALLLLDEVTAALDPATEAAINETLVRAARGRTTVSVTHRLAGARDADCIFVVDAGVVVEQGRHDALIARNGVYAGLWRKQGGFVLSSDGLRAIVAPERLREIPLLRALDDVQLGKLASLFVGERAYQGQVIVNEGAPASLFYLLVRGQATVSRKGIDAAAIELRVLSDGDHFGEVALLYDEPRNATVTARTDCLLLTLARQHFLDLLDEQPAVRAQVERVAAERLASSAFNAPPARRRAPEPS